MNSILSGSSGHYSTIAVHRFKIMKRREDRIATPHSKGKCKGEGKGEGKSKGKDKDKGTSTVLRTVASCADLRFSRQTARRWPQITSFINDRRSTQCRSQILLLSAATTSIYWSSRLDRSDQLQQSAAMFSCNIRLFWVAVYVETLQYSLEFVNKILTFAALQRQLFQRKETEAKILLRVYYVK